LSLRPGVLVTADNTEMLRRLSVIEREKIIKSLDQTF
jgi:hypothetical protein